MARGFVEDSDPARVADHPQFLRNKGFSSPMNQPSPKHARWNWWYLLFVIQLLVLWPPFYNQPDPAWMGIPFFYWFQLLCVIIGAVLTATVYFATEKSDR